jgi:hypothetical protein
MHETNQEIVRRRIGMKKAIGIIVFLAAAAVMAQDIIRGSYSYTYGDSESLVEARKVCKDLALREAIESYRILVESSTKVENYQLKEDVIQSIAASYLQEVKVLSQTEEGRTIALTVEAKVIPTDIQKLIDQKYSSLTTHASGDTAGSASTVAVSEMRSPERFQTIIGDFETTCNRSRGYAHQGDERRASEAMTQLKLRLDSKTPLPDQEFERKLFQAMQNDIALFLEWCHAYQLKNQNKSVRARANLRTLREKRQNLMASSLELRKMENLTEAQTKAREQVLKQCDLTNSNTGLAIQTIGR